MLSHFQIVSSVLTDQLKQWQVAIPHIVVVWFGIFPADLGVILLHHSQTLAPVVHNVILERLLWRLVVTEKKLSSKQIHSHDTEHQPHHQEDQQPVKHSRDGLDQNLHHHLHTDT